MSLLMNRPDHIEVEVTFLPNEHGGRRFPVFSGYRQQFYYDGDDWDTVHRYIGVDGIAPGGSRTARL